MYIRVAIACVIVLITIPRTESGPCEEIGFMEKLLETQKQVIEYVSTFVVNGRLNRVHREYLKSYIARYRREQTEARKNVSHYLANAFNGYILVKSVSKDLENIESFLNSTLSYRKPSSLRYPSRDEFIHTGYFITNLVHVYKLNVTALASGNLIVNYRKDGQPYAMTTTPLTSCDCYSLAMIAYDYHVNNTALDWMMEARNRYRVDCSVFYCSFSEWNIYIFISIVHFEMGRFKSSLRWLAKSREVKGITAKQLSKYDRQKAHVERALNATTKTKKKFTNLLLYMKPKFCTKEIVRSTRLKCHYRYGPHPFLRLARFKMELLNFKPRIMLFHDVITDDEITTLKEIATEKTYDEANPNKTKDLLGDRNSRQSVYIKDNESKVASSLSIRSLDISGFSSVMAAPLKVLHYIATAYHGPHFDCTTYANATADDPCIAARGTVLYYLSEPNLGGATVFPQIPLRVFPEKNAALYWDNAESSTLQQNFKAEHISCPVLHGDKWSMSKWLTDEDLYKRIVKRLESRGLPLRSKQKFYPFSYKSVSN